MSHLIDSAQLSMMLGTEDLLVLDCRYDLADPSSGWRRYEAGHIPGSLYVSLDDDCCAPLSEHGGRHPLPSIEMMTALFSRLGIESGRTRIVCLDDEASCYAARVWWMLRYLGHDDVQVLDGGFAAWRRAGGMVVATGSSVRPRMFLAQPSPSLLAFMDEVSTRGMQLLVDCRATERFRGEQETIDPVAGHIPGAFNVPWRDLLTEDGFFKQPSELSDLLTGIDERVIVYCGSGVTACVNILASSEVGLGLPRLYAGGWSDWISRDANPVAVGG